MFSWICAKCGRDNPPSAVQCLSCGTRFDAPPEETVAAEKPPPPRTVESIPPEPASAPPVSRPAPRPVQDFAASPSPKIESTAPRSGLPTWLLTLLFFFAIVGIGSGIYFGLEYFRNRKAASSTGLDPAANIARTHLSNPLQKYVEVVGIRLLQDGKKRPQARFLVVNHGSSEFDDLSATVTLWASTSRSEEDSIGTFTFKLPALGANESRELTSPLTTRLKFYELPDWQNATPEVQITSP